MMNKLTKEVKLVLALFGIAFVLFLINIASNRTQREFTCEELMSYKAYEDAFEPFADNDIIIPEECYAE